MNSRVLEELKKYDSNLTLAEVIDKVTKAHKLAEKKELDEISRVKSEFKDVYLKRLDEKHIFGTTLEVFHIDDIVDSTRCTDWSLAYFVNGTKIAFSKREIHSRKFNSNSASDTFSEKKLKEMIVITKTEFNNYVSEYNEISKKLNNLIKCKL